MSVNMAVRLMKLPQTCEVISRNICLVKVLKRHVIIAISNGRCGEYLGTMPHMLYSKGRAEEL